MRRTEHGFSPVWTVILEFVLDVKGVVGAAVSPDEVEPTLEVMVSAVVSVQVLAEYDHGVAVFFPADGTGQVGHAAVDRVKARRRSETHVREHFVQNAEGSGFPDAVSALFKKIRQNLSSST